MLPSGVVMNIQGRSQKSQIDDNQIETQIGILSEILQNFLFEFDFSI